MALIEGTDSNDLIQGTSSADSISGLDGDDTLSGGFSGRNFLQGNRGNDFIVGGAGLDTIHGGKNDDTLYGNDGADLMYGDLGNDILLGNRFNDTLYGGAGLDTLHGGKLDDSVFGGQDADRLFGDLGNDFLQGNQGDDWLEGGLGNDVLRGGKGDDWLDGGAGDDTLYGDLGRDSLLGGQGADEFIINDADRIVDSAISLAQLAVDSVNITVGDFNLDEGDTINLSLFDAVTSIQQIIFRQEGDNLIMSFEGRQVVLLGVARGIDSNEDPSGQSTSQLIAKLINRLQQNIETASEPSAVVTPVSPPVPIPAFSGVVVSVTFLENALNASAAIVDPAVTLENAGSLDYDTGTITIGYSVGGGAEDQLTLQNGGNITLVGTSVRHTGVEVGQLTSNGANGTNFTVTLNAQATAVCIEEIIERITYQNGLDAPAGTRTITIAISDAGAGTVLSQDIVINVTEEIDIYTLTGGNDVYTTGTLGDTFNTTDANFTSGDTIDGGGGIDMITITDTATVVDASFTNLTNIEVLKIGHDVTGQTVVISTLSDAAGIDTVDTTNISAGNGIFINAFNKINSVSVVGGAGNDSVWGSTAVDVLSGNAGNDTLLGYSGNDSIHGGDDSDFLYGGDDNDSLDGGTGNDRLYGENGHDTLSSSAGSNRFYGEDGDDSITGGNDTDRIHPGLGNDTIDGGAGVVDSVRFDHTSNDVTVDLLAGTASAGAGDLDSISNVEYVYTFAGNDHITGDAANNVVFAGAGNDTITGGGGIDTLYGEVGNDTFVYIQTTDSGTGGGARDIIGDFTHGADQIDVSAFAGSFTFVGTAAYSGVQEIRHYTSGSNTVVEFDLDGDQASDFRVELIGAITLDANDFVF